MSTEKIQLPDRLTTKLQLKEVMHEVETILDQAVQGSIRKEQTGKEFGVNKPSQLLKELLVLHNAQLNIDSLRSLQKTLKQIEKDAIVIRIVLSAEANEEIKGRLVRWFRTNFDAPILMRFGIQPNIAGGCLVYTPNHRYDLSLRAHIEHSKVSIRQAVGNLS